jgi:hypothetical protein
MPITNDDRIKWIAENINYIEHHASKEHPYNFWPHEESKDPLILFQEDKCGMTLIEYIDSRIRGE